MNLNGLILVRESNKAFLAALEFSFQLEAICAKNLN